VLLADLFVCEVFAGDGLFVLAEEGVEDVFEVVVFCALQSAVLWNELLWYLHHFFLLLSVLIMAPEFCEEEEEEEERSSSF